MGVVNKKKISREIDKQLKKIRQNDCRRFILRI